MKLKLKIINRLFFAFTLSEVLIVLGIIGIVAAMTIPSLIKNIQNTDLSTQIKKNRSILSNTLNSAINDYGGSLNGKDLGSDFGKYAKLLENCNLTHSYNCWHDDGVVKILQQDHTYKTTLGKTQSGLLLVDGSFIRIGSGNLNCSKDTASDSCYDRTFTPGWCGMFYVDVNGKRGPNIFGQDVRELNIWADGYARFLGDDWNRSRYSAAPNKPESAYLLNGSCYDGNSYGTTNY